MYAQEIQAKLLSQLGRVGVPVPPALAFEGTVTLRYAAKSGKVTSEEFPTEETPCYIVSARQSDQEAMLQFPRQFIRKLIGVLEKVDHATLSAAAAGHLKNLLSSNGRDKLRKLTAEGAVLEKDIGHGLFLTKKQAKFSDQSAYWACIVVAMKAEPPVKIEDEPALPIASADPIQVGSDKTD